METTRDVPLGACARCPHILTNPEALPPEAVAGYERRQLDCLRYRESLIAQGARFAEEAPRQLGDLFLYSKRRLATRAGEPIADAV